MIGRVSVPVAVALGVLLGRADAAWPQARRPPARRPPAPAPAPPALSVQLLKVGQIDGRSARDQRPYGPMASAVMVEIGAPVAGLTVRIDRATTTAKVGETVLPASFVFIVGGDNAIVDATATGDAVPWETAIGIDTRRVLGPAVRPVLDLRLGGWIEFRFTRGGILQLAVVFNGDPAALASATIAGTTLDVARTRMRLTGEWEGSFAWRGVIGRLHFTVDSASSELTDLTIGFTCTDSAGRRRPGLPRPQPDLAMNIPTPLAPIGATGAFAFASKAVRIAGAGRFMTADSATGTFTGADSLGCVGSSRVALRGRWVARRSAPSVPPRAPYSFRVDTIVASFSIRDAQLYQPACAEVRDTGDFEMRPAQGAFSVRPPGGQIEISGGTYCIWPHGAVHRWIGTHNAVRGPIRSIRSDATTPLRFRVHRDSGYVYLSGKGTLTTTNGQVVELPLGARLVGEDREIATMRRTSDAAEREARAVELLQRSCDGGDAAGCYSLGLAYVGGRGVPRSDARAVELLGRACDGGNMAGCVGLGGMYERHSGVAPNLAHAVELYQRACNGGYMPGCANLGWMHEDGRGVAQNSARAVELFRQACDGGAMSGCAGLGAMYGVGHGVALDDARAVELYRQACDGGSASGCADLGGMYGVGRGVAQNDARAAELYRAACDGGSLSGCVILGWTYRHGRGLPVSATRALESFSRACEGGNLSGCAGLGWIYRGFNEVQSDRTRTVELYRRACDGGYVRSCYDLAVDYSRGEGVELDRMRASQLERHACDGGYMLGCAFLAIAYENGSGVAQDPARALELHRQACEGGLIGTCALPGDSETWPPRLLGADRDERQRTYARAAERYRHACDGGDAAECFKLGVSYFDARGVPADRPRAAVLFRQACDGGFARACASLGWMYEGGFDVVQNLARAADLFQRACDVGHTASCTWLRGLPSGVRR